MAAAGELGVASENAARLEHWMRLVADAGFDGWLIADFRWSNPLFARALGLETGILTRRCFLWLPAAGHGDPRVLASRVDGHAVSGVPCAVSLYEGHEDMASTLGSLLPRGGRMAMEYVERGTLPTVSRVDAGLVELIRALGVTVMSSGLLIAALDVWNERQRALHQRAARGVDAARAQAFAHAADLLSRGETVTEGMLAATIHASFARDGLEAGSGPDVAFGAHAADPHYSIHGPGATLVPDSVVLIDLWARVRDTVGAPYADSTWMGYAGTRVAPDVLTAFDTLRTARDAAIEAIDGAVRAAVPLPGRMADRTAREVIARAGLLDHVMHRTGHSLGVDHIHGMGTNLDDVEFPDDRPLLVGAGFTVEPGLYLPGRFGLRLEVSAVLLPDRVLVTTERQEALTLLAMPGAA